MRFSVDFDSILNEKWLIFIYMYNNVIRGHAILKKMSNLVRLGVYVNQIRFFLK